MNFDADYTNYRDFFYIKTNLQYITKEKIDFYLIYEFMKLKSVKICVIWVKKNKLVFDYPIIYFR
jgi:hypothetical protein